MKVLHFAYSGVLRFARFSVLLVGGLGLFLIGVALVNANPVSPITCLAMAFLGFVMMTAGFSMGSRVLFGSWL